MFKKIFILLLLLFISCTKTTHVREDCLIINNLYQDEYGYIVKYHFKIYNHYSRNDYTNEYYFVDTIGAYNVGDTIFKSTLSGRVKK
jgi:hypothetical protein